MPNDRASPKKAQVRPKLLVLDTGYTLAAIQRRGQEFQVESRDLGGFFAHVWSVHPFATIQANDNAGSRYGPSVKFELLPRHTIVEGKIGRFSWLKWAPPLNFLLSQAGLFITLAKLVRRENIRIVMAFSPLYLGLFGLALARLTGAKLVVRVGANFAELRRFTGRPSMPGLFPSARIEEAVERIVLKRADLVGGANQNNLDWALANGARADRSALMRYGNLIYPAHFTDPGRREVRQDWVDALQLPEPAFIMMVGRLENVASMKHPGDIVRIVAALRGEGLAINAVIVGEGPLHQEVIDLARTLRVEDNVRLVGSKDQDWLAAMLPRATAFVSTQAGRALTEAALAALPAIAYDIDWQRELIVDGKTGYLVPYRNLDTLIDRTRQVVAKPREARRMGRALRRRTLEMMDPAKLNDHQRQLFRPLLAGAD